MPYLWAFKQAQNHIFWTRTEGDTADFVFGLVLTGKPAGLMGRGTAGRGTGKTFVTWGLPVLFTSPHQLAISSIINFLDLGMQNML